jgi:hypothetical protein
MFPPNTGRAGHRLCTINKCESMCPYRAFVRLLNVHQICHTVQLSHSIAGVKKFQKVCNKLTKSSKKICQKVVNFSKTCKKFAKS